MVPNAAAPVGAGLTPVCLVTDGLVHPSLPARFLLRRILTAARRFDLCSYSTLEKVTPDLLQSCRALVLYVHHKTISTGALDALIHYVRHGGGLLALHSAAASFKQEPRYHELLGGVFDRHGAVGRFTVIPDLAEDEVFRVRGPFSLTDERYLHRMLAQVRVHYSSLLDGKPEPFVWTHLYGAGRVCYCAAGHTLAALRSPEIARILLDGLTWACGGDF